MSFKRRKIWYFFFKKKISSFDLFLIYIDIKNILFTYLIQGTNI